MSLLYFILYTFILVCIRTAYLTGSAKGYLYTVCTYTYRYPFGTVYLTGGVQILQFVQPEPHSALDLQRCTHASGSASTKA